MVTYTFDVDMTCSGCERAINAVLSKTEGVSNIKIDVPTKKVVCDSAKLSAEEVLAQIKKTGKKASIAA